MMQLEAEEEESGEGERAELHSKGEEGKERLIDWGGGGGKRVPKKKRNAHPSARRRQHSLGAGERKEKTVKVKIQGFFPNFTHGGRRGKVNVIWMEYLEPIFHGGEIGRRRRRQLYMSRELGLVLRPSLPPDNNNATN